MSPTVAGEIVEALFMRADTCEDDRMRRKAGAILVGEALIRMGG